MAVQKHLPEFDSFHYSAAQSGKKLVLIQTVKEITLILMLYYDGGVHRQNMLFLEDG